MFSRFLGSKGNNEEVLQMREYFDSFLRRLEVDGSSKTNVNNYRNRLRSFLKIHGHKTPDQITAADADEWVYGMHVRDLSPRSISGYVQALKAFENHLRKWHPKVVGDIPFADHLKRGKTTIDHARAVLDDNEVSRMLRAAHSMFRTGDPKLMSPAIVVCWILSTGARNGEVRLQRVDDLGIDTPQKVKGENGQENVYTAIIRGASGSGKSAPSFAQYREPMAQMLRLWLQVRPQPRDGTSNSFVFTRFRDCGQHWGEPPATCMVCSAHGRKMNSHNVRNACEIVAKRAGVTQLYSPHNLRHWFITYYIEQVKDLEVVKEIARHKNISTTLNYTHRVSSRVNKTKVMIDPLSNL